MDIKPSDEQLAAIACYETGENLAIEALAGSGKTTTLRMLVERGSPRGGKILYTSFGAKVVADAKGKFPKGVRVSTIHGLAWPAGVKYQEQGRLRSRISPNDLLTRLGWSDLDFGHGIDARTGAHCVLQTLAQFCQGADKAIAVKHAMASTLRACRGEKGKARDAAQVIASKAADVWADMMRSTSSMPVTHDVYLKEWALAEPRLPYATVMMDECQDSQEVFVQVLRNQKHAQLVIVGDARQSIYSWRGSVNSMDSFDIAHRVQLTQSFRFGPEIAEVANAILHDQCGADITLRGDPNQPGFVSVCDTPHCYLARTNASLIGQLFEVQRDTPGYKVGVVGGVADMVKLVDAAEQLQAGIPTTHPELAEFAHWQAVREAIAHDGYAHLRMLVRIVDEFGSRQLRDSLERIRGNEAEPETCDVMLSTAHKAKGSEFETVKLLDDFKVKGPEANPGLFGWTPEEGNLLYVAVTRARVHLDISECQAVLASLPEGWMPSFPVPESTGDDYDMASIALGEGPSPPAWRRRRLEAGVWDHPLIANATLEISEEAEGYLVRVVAAGGVLFETWGDLSEVGAETGGHLEVTVGSARLHVPRAALA